LIFATSQGTQVYTAQYGNYVQMGNYVMATFDMILTENSGTGNLSINITDLPRPQTSSGIQGTLTVTYASVTTQGVMVGTVTSGATSVPIYGWYETNPSTSALTYTTVTEAEVGSTPTLQGLITYISV
jgi:hypothetical protein